MIEHYSFVQKHNLKLNKYEETLTVIMDGKPRNVSESNEKYQEIKKHLLNGDREAAAELIDIIYGLKKVYGDLFTVEGSNVIIDGEKVPVTLGARILSLFNANLPHKGFVEFWKNLRENSSGRSKKCLYDFLEKNTQNGQPVVYTEDGCFIAYKAVRHDFYDLHSGTILNLPGTVVSMPRNEVDDDPASTCSFGLHVAAWGYISGTSYGDRNSGNKYLMLKVNPKDVVAVPHDYDFQKMRVCAYEILRETEQPLPNDVFSVSATGDLLNKNEEPEDDGEEDEYEDEDCWYENEDEDDEEDEESADDEDDHLDDDDDDDDDDYEESGFGD